MAQYGDGYFITVQQIKIALALNDTESARAMWERMSKESYRQALSLMSAPHYTDPINSLAQVCEMGNDIAGAIEARKLELEISEKEWGDTTGESVDFIRREIARLKKCL